MTEPDRPDDPDGDERAELAEEFGVDPWNVTVDRSPDGDIIIIHTWQYGGGMWNSGSC